VNILKVDADKLQGVLNFVGECLRDKPSTLGIIQSGINEAIVKDPLREEAKKAK